MTDTPEGPGRWAPHKHEPSNADEVEVWRADGIMVGRWPSDDPEVQGSLALRPGATPHRMHAIRWNMDGTTEVLSAEGEWQLWQAPWRERFVAWFRPKHSPPCRTYFGSHGCRLRRGHPAWRRHRCRCGLKALRDGHFFGDDVP